MWLYYWFFCFAVVFGLECIPSKLKKRKEKKRIRSLKDGQLDYRALFERSFRTEQKWRYYWIDRLLSSSALII